LNPGLIRSLNSLLQPVLPALPLTVWLSHLNSTVLWPVTSMVVLSWGHVLPNLQLQRVKIALLQPLPRHLPLFVMPLANLHSYIAAKEISVSVLQSLKDFQVYVTLFQLVHH
jgi:hypothetical protein